MKTTKVGELDLWLTEYTSGDQIWQSGINCIPIAIFDAETKDLFVLPEKNCSGIMLQIRYINNLHFINYFFSHKTPTLERFKTCLSTVV